MKRDDLTKLGIESDETIDAIMALNGKDIEKHKGAADTAKAENDTLKTQLKEAGDAIEGFKKLDPEALQKAVEQYKADADQAKKDADTQVAALKFDHALEGALKEAKVKDPADVIPHIKKDMLKLGDDGKFIGLQEQLDPLKTSKDYLFDSETPTPRIVTGGNNQPINGDKAVDAAREAAGLKVATPQGK